MKKSLLLLICFTASSLFVNTIEAAEPPILNGGILPGPESTTEGEKYLTNKFLPGITNGFLIALLAISVIMFIAGGVMYLTAQGDTDQTKKAFDTIFWAVMGLVIAILSFAAVKFLVGINFTPFSQTSISVDFNSAEVFPSWAGEETTKVDGVIGENEDGNLILQYIPSIINIMIKIIAPIVLVMFVISGMRFISANGKDEELTKAKSLFADGFLGLIWIAISYSIVKAIYFFFAT